jgi:peptidoglycan/LPS O-acetylase OafA/YrhL
LPPSGRRRANTPALDHHVPNRESQGLVRAAPSHHVPSAGLHVPALDGLRGIAVLTVVVLHFSFLHPHTAAELTFFRITSIGWMGVDLFFVLSGFLITGILIDARNKAHYFRTFFIRRTLRIFPLYYAFLLIVLVVLPYARSTAPETNELWLVAYLGNVLMATAGWEGMPSHTTHLWSLSIEEQFYLVWPFVVYRVDNRRLVRICAAAFGLAIATRAGLFAATADGIAGYTLLPARLDPLAAGALLATLLRIPGGFDLVRRWVRPVATGSLAVLAGVAALNVHSAPLDSLLPPLALSVQVVGYSAIALLAAAVVASAVATPAGSMLDCLLTARPLLSLGRYSYAIYLFHVPLRDALRSHFERAGTLPLLFGSQLAAQFAVIAFGLGLSWLVALVSWHGFEKHFIALKDRLAPSSGRALARVPAEQPIDPAAQPAPLLVPAAPPAR